MARLKEHYRKEVVPALVKQFGYASVMQVPRIEKIVLNMGVGEATNNPVPMVSSRPTPSMMSSDMRGTGPATRGRVVHYLVKDTGSRV